PSSPRRRSRRAPRPRRPRARAMCGGPLEARRQAYARAASRSGTAAALRARVETRSEGHCRHPTQEGHMAGRAALVTGGSSGIGLAIARALGQDGYALTVSARRPDKLEEAVRGLRDEGLEAEAVPANMAKEEDILALVK